MIVIYVYWLPHNVDYQGPMDLNISVVGEEFTLIGEWVFGVII